MRLNNCKFAPPSFTTVNYMSRLSFQLQPFPTSSNIFLIGDFLQDYSLSYHVLQPLVSDCTFFLHGNLCPDFYIKAISSLFQCLQPHVSCPASLLSKFTVSHIKANNLSRFPLTTFIKDYFHEGYDCDFVQQ